VTKIDLNFIIYLPCWASKLTFPKRIFYQIFIIQILVFSLKMTVYSTAANTCHCEFRLNIATLQDETTMFSRNFGNQTPSDTTSDLKEEIGLQQDINILTLINKLYTLHKTPPYCVVLTTKNCSSPRTNICTYYTVQ
jgi:hypothetical protein